MLKILKLGALFLAAFFFLSHLIGTFLPNVTALKNTNPSRTAFMGDKSRKVKQHWVSLARISRNLRQAVIVSEDGSFYQHHGIDFHEFKESIKKNVYKRSFARGFSTITMQLARNLYLSPQKSITRKMKEIVIAYWMERELSKDRILEIYLNVIEWGRGIYGAEAAARHYFGKSVSSLSSREAAFLAAIIPGPQRLGRWPPGPYIESRIGKILKRMNTRWPQQQNSELTSY